MDQRMPANVTTWGSEPESTEKDLDWGTILSTLHGMSGESSNAQAALQPVNLGHELVTEAADPPDTSGAEFITLEVNAELPSEETSYEYFPPEGCVEQLAPQASADNVFYQPGVEVYLPRVYMPLYQVGPAVCYQSDYQPVDGNIVNPPAASSRVRTRQYAAMSHDSSPKAPTPRCKLQRQFGQQKDAPYIRRPPNAFMIFMRENRAKITNTLKPKHSVEANTILGKMWKSMSPAEQEKYYQLAAVERRRHAEQHPDWSSKDNYGQKRKRQRTKLL
ncbi:lymphoid enhancer-binding factor 1-like isoform X1 [Synchiropus splendidus]|uniref:lymphoid enhancer-binding factor 1-like isoform X1 n=1 Tax=Synchiropus splendidus TaxID=270530 RepID=UPI00237E7642|nr:lymphoid enhancer-binding factor 1-like isoform X1 [Synchiropus splendidus]